METCKWTPRLLDDSGTTERSMARRPAKKGGGMRAAKRK